ncbi:MAG: HEPN domain-containing protein [Acidobacteria bacterium]|nr:HEPN domain-containing protein [Acidobacteriota bacterium]
MKKLKPQRTDFEQISQYLAGAEKKLASAKKILSVDEEAAYQLAYEAMLKGSLGFMLSHGVRPRSLPGHHVTIIEFAEKHLGTEFKDLISMFNRMRRKRHDTIYQVSAFISQKEAEDALATAGKYLAAIRHAMQQRNPQMKLI